LTGIGSGWPLGHPRATQGSNWGNIFVCNKVEKMAGGTENRRDRTTSRSSEKSETHRGDAEQRGKSKIVPTDARRHHGERLGSGRKPVLRQGTTILETRFNDDWNDSMPKILNHEDVVAKAGPLTQQELDAINCYWHAANYLSVGQIYLRDNALLRDPLKLEHTKPRLLGHFGTTPG